MTSPLLPFQISMTRFRLPEARPRLDELPCLVISTVNDVLDTVKRLVDVVYHQHQGGRCTAHLTTGICGKDTDGGIQVLTLFGKVDDSTAIDEQQQRVGTLDTTTLDNLLIELLQHGLVLAYLVRDIIVGAIDIKASVKQHQVKDEIS